jgi:hypothetical protein
MRMTRRRPAPTAPSTTGALELEDSLRRFLDRRRTSESLSRDEEAREGLAEKRSEPRSPRPADALADRLGLSWMARSLPASNSSSGTGIAEEHFGQRIFFPGAGAFEIRRLDSHSGQVKVTVAIWRHPWCVNRERARTAKVPSIIGKGAKIARGKVAFS